MANPKKILIADDEKALAKALQLKLNHSGFETSTAFDGAEALEMLKKESFDLLLLDLVMPKMDGFQVLEEIAKLSKKPKVIVTSNLGQEEDAEKAKSKGAIHFFVKSDTPITEIVEYVRSAL
jgi:DNA-binding response OmpR family regulator